MLLTGEHDRTAGRGYPVMGWGRPQAADWHAGQSQRRHRLLVAVRALPTGQRECVLLVLEGFNSREIADILGIAVNTVDQRLSRARHKLRTILEERE